MINLIIPARYINTPLSTALWTFLCVANFHLYVFTLFSLIPYCERLILQPSSHLHRHARKRIQIYALVGTVGVSRIISSCVGFAFVLYCVSAAEHTASARAGVFLNCLAVLLGLIWVGTSWLSLVGLERLVRMVVEQCGAEAGTVESGSLLLGEKKKEKEKVAEKGGVVVMDAECAV